jgi:hypothetical protein
MDPYKKQNELIQQQLQQMMVGNSGNVMEKHVTKVNGRAGAEAFALPANSDDFLLDINDPVIWFVQTDGAGYKTVTPYDISPHKEVKQEDVIKSMEDRITKLEEALRNGKSNYAANPKQSKSGNVNNDASSRSNDKG